MSSLRRVSPPFPWVLTWPSAPGFLLLLQPSDKGKGTSPLKVKEFLRKKWPQRACWHSSGNAVSCWMLKSLGRNQNSSLAIANDKSLEMDIFIMRIQVKTFKKKETSASTESKTLPHHHLLLSVFKVEWPYCNGLARYSPNLFPLPGIELNYVSQPVFN